MALCLPPSAAAFASRVAAVYFRPLTSAPGWLVATKRSKFSRLSSCQRTGALQCPKPQSKRSEAREPYPESYPRAIPRTIPAIHTPYTNTATSKKTHTPIWVGTAMEDAPWRWLRRSRAGSRSVVSAQSGEHPPSEVLKHRGARSRSLPLAWNLTEGSSKTMCLFKGTACQVPCYFGGAVSLLESRFG